MKDLKEFDISFIGLKEGMHQFDYEIGNEFFDFFNYNEFNNSKIQIALSFLKKTTMFELNFSITGWVEVNCDITNELFHQPIESDTNLIVKFGEKFNDDNEELLIIPHNEHKINVAQYIYEFSVLAVPFKRVHPGVIDGTLHSDILDKLKELEVKEKGNKEENIDSKNNDPRWDKLKDILIDKNTSNGTS